MIFGHFQATTIQQYSVNVFFYVALVLGVVAALSCHVCPNPGPACNDPVIKSNLEILDCSTEESEASINKTDKLTNETVHQKINQQGEDQQEKGQQEKHQQGMDENKQQMEPLVELDEYISDIDLSSSLGCIKAVSTTPDGAKSTMRGCGAHDCSTAKLFFGENATIKCKYCITNLCNSSVQISKIGWIYVLIAMNSRF